MEIPPDELNSSSRSLVLELESRGYELAQGQHDTKSFENILLVFERGSTRVRIVRDRGQWFVGASAARWNDWFDPVIWRAFLDSALPQIDVASFEWQCKCLVEDLARIERSTTRSENGTLTRLDELRSARAAIRRALPPISE